MVHGVGVDIMDIKRIRPLSSDLNDPFFIKTFSGRERAEGLAHEDPVHYFGGRFSAKEAVFKAMRISSDSIRLNEIEILNDKEGRPYVNLFGRAKELALESGIMNISVALSYEEDMVIAFAVTNYSL